MDLYRNCIRPQAELQKIEPLIVATYLSTAYYPHWVIIITIHRSTMSSSLTYKVFVPLISASITVDQIRTEISIQEYGLVTEVQFLPLYKTPKFCDNYVKPSDIKSAAITIRKPANETVCRENFLYWRVRSGRSCVVKPAAFKDPLFEFWHLKPYEETTSEIRESVDDLTSRVDELRRLVDTLLMESILRRIVIKCAMYSRS